MTPTEAALIAFAETPPRTRKDWTQSYSSKVITPRYLKADQVTFPDLGHALAQRIRFCGQLREMGYSVAQHVSIGAELIAAPFALAFLLHDCGETYLPDIPSPLKPYLRVRLDDGSDILWTELEAQHADAIFEALNLRSIRPLIDSPEVKAMDLAMLMTEKRDLASPEPQPWGIDVEPLSYRITSCWEPEFAEATFNRLFAKLTAPVGSAFVSGRVG